MAVVHPKNAVNRFEHHPTTCHCAECISHPSQARPGVHVFPDRLHVITMLENPLRWRSRYSNFAAFERMVEAGGADLYVAEIAFGDRHFEVAEEGNPKHLRLRSKHELWHKENALNLLIQRLPSDAEYIAWIDADVQFQRPDWAQETMHLLQHYKVIQMFSHSIDLGPRHEPLGQRQSFLYRWVEDQGKHPDPGFTNPQPGPDSVEVTSGYGYGRVPGRGKKKGTFWHPGLAWAARRSALEQVGMLLDHAILGAGDWYMASSLVGQAERSFFPGASDTYMRYIKLWEERAEKYIKRNVGYMPGTVTHLFHGTKADRQYDTRWKLLARTGFDPERDLKRDWQGLWQLTDRSVELRDGIRAYARARNEDGFAQ